MAREEPSSARYYIVTLNETRRNSELIDKNNVLKADKIRNADYTIVPESKWLTMQDSYDVEIPAKDVYNLFITFRCHGESHKNIYVHGSEKVFDAILTLFVNKTLGLADFNRLFIVRWRGEAIDSTVSFSWFGSENRDVELTVERRSFSNLYESCGSVPEVSHSHARDSPLLYVSSTGAAPRVPCVGLSNLGNTCFISSAIQCLNNCTLFAYFFVHNLEYCTRSKSRILQEWARLVYSMATGSDSSIRALKSAIGESVSVYRGFEEQDSCEFITYLLDSLNEIIKSDTTIQRQIKPTLNSLRGLGANPIDRNTIGSQAGDSQQPSDDSQQPSDGTNSHEGISSQLTDSSLNKGKNQEDINDETHRSSCADEYWNSFLSKNNTPVALLFYSIFATILTCTACGFTKHRYDPIASLPLPIPTLRLFRSAILLIFDNKGRRRKPPMRVHVPLCNNITGLIKYVRKHYAISGNILAVEYSKHQPIRMLEDSIPLSDVANRICLYEHSIGEAFFIFTFHFRKLLIFTEKFPVDFMVPSCNHTGNCTVQSDTQGSVFKLCSENRDSIFRKLEPYLLYQLSVDELFACINSTEITYDTVFHTARVVLHTNKQSILFGNNIELIDGLVADKPEPPTIYDCLGDFLKDSYITSACEGCKAKTEYKMEVSIQKLPKILILQLKRFTYNYSEAKLNTFVDFPLRDFIVDGHHYDLVASCNHIEIGMGSGHYVAYIYKNNSWYCCNDSVISKCDGPDKKSVYLLFYERNDVNQNEIK